MGLVRADGGEIGVGWVGVGEWFCGGSGVVGRAVGEVSGGAGRR